MVAPRKDRMKIAAPMMAIGMIIETFRRAKLKPTAKASRLVATDNIRSLRKSNPCPLAYVPCLPLQISFLSD